MSVKLRKLERDLARATRAVEQELERMLIDAVVTIARRNPGKRVEAISAMGTWFLHVDDEERSPACFRAFEHMQNDWGWNVIPAPVRLWSTDGGQTIERLTDW